MEEVERRESSTRRSSAAITGCQLAKKSNARLPSLCDAMLMVCRCLFSTRCLHTWLDPRGISEMFLAPIRNHILLPFIPLAVPSAARRSLSLSLSSFPSILPLPHPRLPPCRACRVCRPRPPIVDADDIATRVFRSFPPRLPGQICLCTAFIYSTAVEPPPRIGRTTLASCVSRESPRERANYNPRWAQLIARARPPPFRSSN